MSGASGAAHAHLARDLPVERASGAAPATTTATRARVEARGKFLFAGDEKLWVRGVTYGTFAPDADGREFPPQDVVVQDFAAMAGAGFNTVRVYTVPPRWLLDRAADAGLRVMVGLPWEQHVAFLDDPRRADDIVRRVARGVAECSGHPAVLCYAIGNEIPASIVRWHGKRAVERFLERLYRAAKAADAHALVTYVNFPTTEYLELPFLDLCCFNVYLESRDRLEAYLARLQNLSDDRPLMLAEIGLDSRRNGEAAQASSLAWQLRSAFAAGCAGACVFAWTDEWHRGGHDIDDWDFGLTTRARESKPALAAVTAAFADAPFPADTPWPRVSVVVCSYNGARTIRDTLDGLAALAYPDYEVIVVDDGSTDATASIAAEYEVRLISTHNRGLSAARNTGWEMASGEIVAYIDDDAWPDPHWLHYLAWTFLTTQHAGAGGPNVAPPGDGTIAECVANAPGGPVHVLVDDTVAEHVPGCNMAFRRDALEAVGGFDPRFRTAGDDVDLCWRLQDAGMSIGFHAGALDWHHRRNSVRTYWKQQVGYGRAEALLEDKWPERYNGAGHTAWAGRLYGRGLTLSLAGLGGRIYQGVWGSAPFQSLYARDAGSLGALPLMPEWYLVTAVLAIVALLGLDWAPLAVVGVPLLAVALLLPVAQAVLSARRARFPGGTRDGLEDLGLRALTAWLHLQQPAARLTGRLRHGLTPWRRRGRAAPAWPWPRTVTLWRETWRAPEDSLSAIESALRARGAVIGHGDAWSDWDLGVRGGLLGGARVRLGVEEHGAGRQMLRVRLWPRVQPAALAATAVAGACAALALAGGAAVAGGVLLAAALGLALLGAGECARAGGIIVDALAEMDAEDRED